MKTVFLSGSIKIKSLSDSVKVRLGNMVQNNLHIIVGDANGADLAFQKFFDELNYQNVIVYCVGAPRNNASNWNTEVVMTKHRAGSRAYYTAKDEVMAVHSDCGFMVWDSQSPGTLKNVIELLKTGKKSVVYVNTKDEFIKITNAEDFEKLTSYMSDTAFAKANEKLKLISFFESLTQKKSVQQELSIE